jgi:hypothetical protein
MRPTASRSHMNRFVIRRRELEDQVAPSLVSRLAVTPRRVEIPAAKSLDSFGVARIAPTRYVRF